MQCKLSEHSVEYAHASVDMRCSTANVQFSATAISSRLELKPLKVFGTGADPNKDNRLKF